MTVYVYHSGIKQVMNFGNYKTRKGAFRRCAQLKIWWVKTNTTWMHCYIGE